MRGIRLPVGAGAPISPPSSSGSRDEPKKKSGPKTRSFCLPPAPWATTSKTWPQVTELLRRIEEIVAPTVVGMGYELVRVAMSRGGGTLQIMIEPADGRAMDVEDCATVSRALSAVLDVEDPIPSAYTLEVSSPGIDRPLTRPKDYARWAGHIARVEIAQPIEGQRQVCLLAVVEAELHGVFLQSKQRSLEPPLAAVTRAKLEMTDRLVEEHRRAQDGANHAH